MKGSFLNLFRSALAVSAALFLTADGRAQQFSITAGSINACQGVLEDSGGPSGQYGNNENFTVVICPDNPGDVISLQWIVWDLSGAGPNNTIDRIRVWDGDSNAATSLGEYTANDAMTGIIIMGTTFNTTGCLTVQFVSNGTGMGNFAATINCTTPCDRPTAVASMSEAGPALLCVDEMISFDGSGSFAAPGFNVVNYTWNFDDGTNSTGPSVQHSFSEPGEYLVQLLVLDNNDCVNSNVVDLQVQVSTPPNFNGTLSSTEVCLGAEADLNAMVEPTTWTDLPEANFGEPLELPDDVGIPFTSELTFTQFEPGQLLTDPNDLLSICVSMEHSFMGDLALMVTCPNGTSIVVHQQGGGGTFLGDANDGDSGNDIQPGTCWEYCWAPDATNPTWADAATSGFTMDAPSTDWAQSLVPGTYSSVQPWSNLQGCPLNGTWTFTSTDLWGADNGTICGWSLNFDPSIIPDLSQFTPILAPNDPDSAGWTGPNFVGAPNDPLSGTALLDTPGDYAYQFSVTDNFGCTYDTTVTVTVNPPIEVSAGPDQTLCNEAIQLNASAIGGPSNCQWHLQLNDLGWDGWNGGSLSVLLNGTAYPFTLNSGNLANFNIPVTAGSSIELIYTSGNWESEVSYLLTDDVGATIYSAGPNPPTGTVFSGTITCGGVPALTYEWFPANALDDASLQNPTVTASQTTAFVVLAYPPGFPECATTDSVTIFIDPSVDPGTDSSIVICASSAPFELYDILGGTPVTGGIWTNELGATVSGTFTPLTDASGIYTYTVENPSGCQGTADITIEVIPLADPICCGVVDAGPDTVLCVLTHFLAATPGPNGVGQWEGPTQAVFSNALDPASSVTMPVSGRYTFYWHQTDGPYCDLIDSVEVTLTTPMEVVMTLTDAICFDACDGTAIASVTGGNDPASFVFEWSGNVAGASDTAASALCDGDYTVLVTDSNSCSVGASYVIAEPVLLEIDTVRPRITTCYGFCDGQIYLADAEAVLFSFDGGETYGTTSVIDTACMGLYQVAIQNAAGCIGRAVVLVPQPPEVIADFVWWPDPVMVSAPTVHFTNISQQGVTFNWQFDDLDSSTVEDPVYSFPYKYGDVYEVCMQAYDANQCVDSVCIPVVVNEVLQTFLPNAFTPNGDGFNDDFGLIYNVPDMENFSLRIFDRWGKLVFESNDPNARWSGGAEASSVYVWKLNYRSILTDTGHEKIGHVSLLR